jgi:hypothetical protein
MFPKCVQGTYSTDVKYFHEESASGHISRGNAGIEKKRKAFYWKDFLES